MNEITLYGTVGKDAETIEFNEKHAKKITLAVNGSGKDAPTVWWSVMCWDPEKFPILKHVKKGSSLIVSGDMKNAKSYTKKDGTIGIDMSMTPYRISFNPFYRKKEGSDEQEAKTPYVAKAATEDDDSFPGF